MGGTQINEKRQMIYRVICTACTVLLVLFIFRNSSDTGDISGGKSQSVLAWVNGMLETVGLGGRFTEYQIRKLGHLGEYMLLGFSLLLTTDAYAGRVLKFLTAPLFAGLLVAVLDEAYQLTVPERSGMVLDVLIDFSGLLIGIAIALLFLWVRHRKRRGRSRA